MSEQLILEKLDTIKKQTAKLEQKVDKIESTVVLIAVQSERIDNMQSQVHKLWAKHDDAFGTHGLVSKIKQFQASCPRESIKETVKNQWIAIGLLASIVTGCFFKVFGIVYQRAEIKKCRRQS